MKNSLLSSLVMLALLAGCQGRGLPFHPSMGNKSHVPQPSTKGDNISLEDEKNTSVDFPKLTLKSKSLKKDDSLLERIPIVNKIGSSLLPPLNEIPVLRDIKKLLPKSDKDAAKRVHQKYQRSAYATNTKSFSGGTIANNLDIGMVRLGQGSKYTRLIFDTYHWEGYAQIPVRKADHSGTYIFTYEPRQKRIVGILDGYQAFSALMGDHKDLYEGNNMVKTIHLDEYLDKSGFKFTIELKQEAKIQVYELDYPGRIIIDMMPLEST